MTITVGLWIIPTILTVACVVMLFRSAVGRPGYSGMYSSAFDALFAMFWLIPIGFIWAAYFAVLYFLNRR